MRVTMQTIKFSHAAFFCPIPTVGTEPALVFTVLLPVNDNFERVLSLAVIFFRRVIKIGTVHYNVCIFWFAMFHTVRSLAPIWLRDSTSAIIDVYMPFVPPEKVFVRFTAATARKWAWDLSLWTWINRPLGISVVPADGGSRVFRHENR